MTSRRPGQGLGAAREPGRLYSNEEPPPVLPRDSVHLRREAGGARGPASRRPPAGEKVRFWMGGGAEGQIVREAVLAAATLRTGATDPLLAAQSPQASSCALRSRGALLCAVRWHCLRSMSHAGIISSLLKKTTSRSREGLASLGRAP